MSEARANVPSIEEISFKLTDEFLPSLASSRVFIARQDKSLEYTHSRISIQLLMPEIDDSGQSEVPNSFWKHESFKTTSGNTTTDVSLRQTTRVSFRERLISIKKPTQNRKVMRKISFHNLQFDQENLTCKSKLIHLSQRKDYSNKGQRLRRSSLKNQNSYRANGTMQRGHHKKVTEEDIEKLVKLKETMKIKPLNLLINEEKEKVYMKQIIKNRCSQLAEIKINKNLAYEQKYSTTRFR